MHHSHSIVYILAIVTYNYDYISQHTCSDGLLLRVRFKITWPLEAGHVRAWWQAGKIVCWNWCTSCARALLSLPLTDVSSSTGTPGSCVFPTPDADFTVHPCLTHLQGPMTPPPPLPPRITCLRPPLPCASSSPLAQILVVNPCHRRLHQAFDLRFFNHPCLTQIKHSGGGFFIHFQPCHTKRDQPLTCVSLSTPASHVFIHPWLTCLHPPRPYPSPTTPSLGRWSSCTSILNTTCVRSLLIVVLLQ